MRSAAAHSSADALAGLEALHARSSTSEQAADAIRRHITEGRIHPGAQLREEAVAAALGVSRNTVREAFRALSREGLVEHALHRGVFVREVTADDVSDIYRTRRLLEPLGLRASAGRGDAIRALDGIVREAEAAAAAEDWASVGTADIAFHRALVDACGSSRVTRLFDQLFAELRLAFAVIDSARTLHEPYVARNRRMTELITTGAVDEACRELDNYLRDAEHQILAALTGS
ncbi:GntR family transcriptional regulator [Planosporangium sp. 12N6]|uniref:GntR family transcriptional regulator n=1 Tax=Planosporangium spinosum TaxID=3402278 RepID=UPI003CEF63BA